MQTLWLVVIFVGLAGLSILAYAIKALDFMGAVASFFLGLLVAIVGGLGWMAVLVVFTGLGIIATRVGYVTKAERRLAEAAGGERGVSNVLGNGLAPALVVLAVPLAPLVPSAAAVVAFATAVAAVTADTLASELGVLSRTSRRILPPFHAAKPGENGAVSMLGQSAALAGTLAISAAAVVLMDLPLQHAWVPVVMGFLGCQLDSVLGATLERDVTRDGPLSKQDVNFLASAIPAFLVLVAGVVLL